MTTKKKHDDEPETPVLGTGASGDPKHPDEGAPVRREVFEPAPVDAPERIEKEASK